MKVIILHRPISEHARSVDEFVHDFTRRNPSLHVELVNIDSREGSSMATMYDITQYPAILALQDDGSAASIWQGLPLPLLDDVAGYAH